MTKQPLVSIIIPTFNRAHLIGETLDSVLAQTYQNWECIVVDDGSTDGTDQLIASHCAKDSRFQYHHRPTDRLPGGNAARNYGFEVSKGEYVQWFDSDDLMLPNKIEVKVKAIIGKKVDFVVCENAEIYSLEPYKYRKRWLIKTEGNTLLNHLKTNVAFTTAGPFFKKNFLKDKLLFDERVLIGQEWEFYSRLLCSKPKIDYIDIVLYHFRNVENGIRGLKSEVKILNRAKTEINLFKYINKSKYFDETIYLDDYNRYKFFLIYNKFVFLRNNLSWRVAVLYIIKGLRTVHKSYYFSSLRKVVFNPKLGKFLFK
ncbi:glycosyltransferase involved in cell wall biosynthesis [Winogradskyella pacifica]|uniref:Glycosyltransferase involved in cell wall biosynthesis n=1 Tax=Winogradskyella pacifica TaxID=664642 RepID=A0A3D9MZB0_9FLAO|nr:glycosyltransferase family 2 protein [Winogradskyella pacifica]REE24457.1 glycosyltransferase involved in cell wall biosynthesis [Winogradskyella pacifica]